MFNVASRFSLRHPRLNFDEISSRPIHLSSRESDHPTSVNSPRFKLLDCFTRVGWILQLGIDHRNPDRRSVSPAIQIHRILNSKVVFAAR